LTTISDSPLLQVLGQKGSVMAANITGSDNPVAILDDKVLDQLSVQCRKAKAEAMKTGDSASAALELCTTLDSVLKAYAHIRDEYYDRIDIERERAEAESRLQDASSALQKPEPPQ
jgi:hypothetical protein